jgi:hypothetical protein
MKFYSAHAYISSQQTQGNPYIFLELFFCVALFSPKLASEFLATSGSLNFDPFSVLMEREPLCPA